MSQDTTKMALTAVAMMILGAFLFVLVLSGDSPAKGRLAVAALVLVGIGYGGLKMTKATHRKETIRYQHASNRQIEQDVRAELRREEQHKAHTEEKKRKADREDALDELIAIKEQLKQPEQPKVAAAFKCTGCGAVNRTSEDGTMTCEYCHRPHG
ncbi:MAG: TFIIB-type zinc finger domain-containing protein [bacterium]|nr:TFIIB-type zinc finger domain-containing protein [bacterium]